MFSKGNTAIMILLSTGNRERRARYAPPARLATLAPAAASIQRRVRWPADAASDFRHSSRSADTAATDEYRASRSFSSALRITRSSMTGIVAFTADGFAGASVRI